MVMIFSNMPGLWHNTWSFQFTTYAYLVSVMIPAFVNWNVLLHFTILLELDRESIK